MSRVFLSRADPVRRRTMRHGRPKEPKDVRRDVSLRLREPRIKYREDVAEGLGNALQTLIGLPQGNNLGKLGARAKQ
jgi:NADPH-dependent curcumin reductase CurA